MRWLAATMLGLLGLAYALIVLGAPSTEVHPSPNDRGLGGLSLLVGALRDAGYAVAYDGSTRPRLGKNDVPVVPVLEDHTIPKEALAHVQGGGNAFVLKIPKALQPIGESLPVRDFAGHKAKVDDVASGEYDPDSGGAVASANVWSYEGTPVSTLEGVGKGRLARLRDGALATNRFLGRLDNAKVVVSTLRPVAPKGRRLVFLAGGYGEAEAPGPIESVGPWAVGAVWQTLAVLAAFGVARGIRFGLPAPEAGQKRGSRELLDAVAGHYRRAKRTDAPLAAAARERPDDPTVQALAVRAKVSEADARRALIALESKPKRRG